MTRNIFLIIGTSVLLLFLLFKFYLVVFGNIHFDVVIVSLDFKQVTSGECVNFLESLSISYPVLLIDSHVLHSLHDENCEHLSKSRIKVGIDKKYTKETTFKNETQFEYIGIENDTNINYFRFETQPKRGIPKSFDTFNIGNIRIPTNIPLFLGMWRRSVLLKCLNLPVKRNQTESQQYNHGKEAAGKLAELRDVLLKFNIFSFLNGGTLLGWYRECGIIPHTYDMDISVFAEDFRLELVQYLQSRTSPFRLLRRIGMLNDSFELTLTSMNGYKINTDLFLMYKEVQKNGTVINWVGGASYAQKYKYIYPEYDPWCSADLLGHLFWVTCSPQKMLISEYGNLWYEDVPSSVYNWKQSAMNVHKNGEWGREELKQVYVMY